MTWSCWHFVPLAVQADFSASSEPSYLVIIRYEDWDDLQRLAALELNLLDWHPDGVASALQAVAEADAQVKGGGTSPEYALERVIRQIAAYRAAPVG